MKQLFCIILSLDDGKLFQTVFNKLIFFQLLRTKNKRGNKKKNKKRIKWLLLVVKGRHVLSIVFQSNQTAKTVPHRTCLVACRCGHNSFKPFSLFIFIFFGSSHLVVVARNTKLELKAIEPNFDWVVAG